MDWLVLGLVLAFAVRGLLTGLVSQTFAILGVIAGLWTAGWCSQWVAAHWHGAQPSVVLWALRWLIVASAGFAVAALLQWWGQGLGHAIESTPVGWIDRPGGFVLGAGMGALISAFALLCVLWVPWSSAADAVARSRTARPMMAGGAVACSLAARYVPGSAWLNGRFQAATRRVEQRARAL